MILQCQIDFHYHRLRFTNRIKRFVPIKKKQSLTFQNLPLVVLELDHSEVPPHQTLPI